MWLPYLQRLARFAPGLLGGVWARVPGPVRQALGPLVHPIAVGSRSGGRILHVPSLPALPRRFDMLVEAEETGVPAAELSSLAAVGHRIRALVAGESLADVTRRESIVDAVYVAGPRATDERLATARRQAFRVVPAARISELGVPGVAFPTVTIIVATFRQSALCEGCLRAVQSNALFPGLEILVVDNGSSDGTAQMLRDLAATDGRIRVLTNANNLGFARAANQGLRAARGEIAVLLNDDTVVAPGWLSRLVRHLESEPRLGLVCPVTNEIGGDARIVAPYETFDEMEAFAARRAIELAGQRRPTGTIALFCAAGRREVFESVGYLDERYEVGMFEDDDLSFALRLQGMELSVADDAFVHHVGQASFGRLSDAEYLAIWEANRRRYEEKWARRWHPPK